MLLYGDHSERLDPAARLHEVSSRLRSGWLSHEALTDVFLDLAGVAQGVADADFQEWGSDRPRSSERVLLEQLTELARALSGSWDHGCIGAAVRPVMIPDDLPEEVEVRLPEGYAFYALRPEAYALAARQLRLSGTPRVIGLRSIGTGLACMAAAALGAPPPTTLRPIGDPFARSLRIDEQLESELLAGDPHFVIVDEGPGLSGSSFGSVADWLEVKGVPPDRIAFLPSHGNPIGRQASEAHRRRWDSAQRPVVGLDEPMEPWLERLIGTLDRPLQEISGGSWRSLLSASETRWPAINPIWERRKFLARTATGTWLVKFSGLGRIGRSKRHLADRLHGAGFGPEVAGLAHGWLVTRWHAEAVPTQPTIDELSAYLRFRAGLPAPEAGASLHLLTDMVRRNLPGWEAWSPEMDSIQPRPICTDNRMASHEWLRLPSRQLLKSDALDHHAAHDLIGCQDIAWDVAGAIVELHLSEREGWKLAEATGADRKLLDFYLVAYIGFRVGWHRMSAASLDHWPEEQRRHLDAADRLQLRLPSVDRIQHACHVH